MEDVTHEMNHYAANKVTFIHPTLHKTTKMPTVSYEMTGYVTTLIKCLVRAASEVQHPVHDELR